MGKNTKKLGSWVRVRFAFFDELSKNHDIWFRVLFDSLQVSVRFGSVRFLAKPVFCFGSFLLGSDTLPSLPATASTVALIVIHVAREIQRIATHNALRQTGSKTARRTAETSHLLRLPTFKGCTRRPPNAGTEEHSLGQRPHPFMFKA